MSHVIQWVPPVNSGPHDGESAASLIRTDAIHLVFTSVDDTLAAARVAGRIAAAMHVPLKLVHFRTVPYGTAVDRPAGVSPIETDAFIERLRDEGIEARARVYLCRHERRAFPMAFKRRSIVVIGGRHRRWPTAEERLRRQLESAGHYVVFVDVGDKEASRA
jgi:hypothetical protein